eukprot:8721904-Alexandrium_andersonii.AAC.1
MAHKHGQRPMQHCSPLIARQLHIPDAALACDAATAPTLASRPGAVAPEPPRHARWATTHLSLIHISEPTRLALI